MSARINAITGATGLLGSYIAEQLIARGQRVRALARPSSDTGLLESLGVELITGDLRQRDSIDPLLVGVDCAYHCAATLGDYGPWSKFFEGTVVTTRNLVAACEKQRVPRLLHVGSVAAYGHPEAGDEKFSEELPLGQNLWLWDYYARSKMEAEEAALTLGDRVTIVRPTWIYGPRDKTILPRIIQSLRAGRVKLIGSGENQLNMVYASDVAQGAILAAEHPQSAGEVYNLCSDGEITQKQLFQMLCDALEIPHVNQRVPRQVAHTFGFLCEAFGKATGRTSPPNVTRHGISLISRPTMFSNKKARTQLGWELKVPVAEGLPRTLQWFQENLAQNSATAAPSSSTERDSAASGSGTLFPANDDRS